MGFLDPARVPSAFAQIDLRAGVVIGAHYIHQTVHLVDNQVGRAAAIAMRTICYHAHQRQIAVVLHIVFDVGNTADLAMIMQTIVEGGGFKEIGGYAGVAIFISEATPHNIVANHGGSNCLAQQRGSNHGERSRTVARIANGFYLRGIGSIERLIAPELRRAVHVPLLRRLLTGPMTNRNVHAPLRAARSTIGIQFSAGVSIRSAINRQIVALLEVLNSPERVGIESAANLTIVAQIVQAKLQGNDLRSRIAGIVLHHILKHHKRMILSELNRQIDGGTLQEIQATAKGCVTLNAQNCTFPDMNFWRYDTYTLLAEVLVCVNIEIDGILQTYDLYCELIVDMRKSMKFGYGECGFLKDKPERDLWLLSSYLVPILRKDEVEQGAEELLLRYCPNALTDRKEHNAYVLAENMGLHVERYPLYRQSATLSVLFFCDGYVVAEEQDEDGRGLDTPYTVKVSAGTIIINTNAVHKDCCQLEIYHECIHYDWHYMFFKLQDMHNSDIRNLKTKVDCKIKLDT